MVLPRLCTGLCSRRGVCDPPLRSCCDQVAAQHQVDVRTRMLSAWGSLARPLCLWAVGGRRSSNQRRRWCGHGLYALWLGSAVVVVVSGGGGPGGGGGGGAEAGSHAGW